MKNLIFKSTRPIIMVLIIALAFTVIAPMSTGDVYAANRASTKTITYTNNVIYAAGSSIIGDLYGRDTLTIKYVPGSKALSSVTAKQSVRTLGTQIVQSHGAKVTFNSGKTKCTVKTTYSLNLSLIPSWLVPICSAVTPYLLPLVNFGTIAKVQTTYTVKMVKGAPSVAKSTKITWFPGATLVNAAKKLFKFLGILF